MSVAHLELAVPDAEAWQAHREGLEAHGGLMVPVPEGQSLELFEAVEVEVAHRGREQAVATGRVVQLAPDGSAAVLFEGEAKESLLGLALSGGPTPGGGGPEQPLWARYETLTKAEKIKLARQGNADARRRVLRDPDQSLHGFLLANPGLTANEVVGWFRAGLVPRAMIEQLVKRTELTSNLQVMEALVQDPRTPIPVALKMVPRISMDVCRRIAKAGKLRSQIVSAARKRVITR